MLLVKNGKIIKDNKLIKKDILIDNEKIIKIRDDIKCDCEIIDAKGCMVIPGATDVHVHF